MKLSAKQGKNNAIGAIGEEIAARFLKKRDFTIITTNYLRKWGEIDIVAHETSKKGIIIHFVEVKTVSYGTKAALQAAVNGRSWRPEENVTREKIQKLARTIETWLAEHKDPILGWQIDVVAVRLVPHEKYAAVKYLENVIL